MTNSYDHPIPTENNFYRDHYEKFAYAFIVGIIIMLILAGIVLFQVTHKTLPPFFANEGSEFGGYYWKVQVPLLVTYQSAELTTQNNFIVSLTIVKVPTQDNPQGIGIDQFVMLKA